MPNGVPKRGRSLAGQRAAGEIGDGPGDHHRHLNVALIEQLGDTVQRRLGVERVKNRFDQNDVDAAVEQPTRLLNIRGFQLIEVNCTKLWPVDIRRERRGAIGWTERPGDKARLAILL